MKRDCFPENHTALAKLQGTTNMGHVFVIGGESVNKEAIFVEGISITRGKDLLLQALTRQTFTIKNGIHSFCPPEAIKVDSKRTILRKVSFTPRIIRIVAHPTYGIWSFGIMLYEIITGKPMSIYASRQSLSDAELVKIGRLTSTTMKKALKRVKDHEKSAAAAAPPVTF